jgi:hypothetical protein
MITNQLTSLRPSRLSLALSMMFDKLSAGTKVPVLLEIFLFLIFDF